MPTIRTCCLSELSTLMQENTIQSTIMEVAQGKTHCCYFNVVEASGKIVRYDLITERSDEPREYKSPGTLSRDLKKENIHRWRVINVDQE